MTSFNKLMLEFYISCEIQLDYKYIYVCRKRRKYSLLRYDIYIGNPLEGSVFNGNLPWFYTAPAKWYYAQPEKQTDTFYIFIILQRKFAMVIVQPDNIFFMLRTAKYCQVLLKTAKWGC